MPTLVHDLTRQLDALAAELSAAGAELKTAISGGGDAKEAADASRLCEAVEAFREALARSEVNDAAPAAEATRLSGLRHDWKNRLNHIVGPAQFIAMSRGGVGAPKALERVLDLCHRCLDALNGEGAPLAPLAGGGVALAEPVKPAEHPGRILVADDDAENRVLLAR